MDCYLDKVLDIELEGGFGYPFLGEEVVEELKEKGIIVIGSKTMPNNKINCQEYVRLYLNNKFNFHFNRDGLGYKVSIGLINSILRHTECPDPNRNYICIYTNYTKGMNYKDLVIDHYGVVLDSSKSLVISKYNYSNLLIHHAKNPYILESFCSNEETRVLFIDLEDIRWLLTDLED